MKRQMEDPSEFFGPFKNYFDNRVYSTDFFDLNEMIYDIKPDHTPVVDWKRT